MNPLPEKFRAGESFVFKGVLDGNSVAVRITHPKRRTINQLESELEWIDYISNNGVSVPHVHLSTNGKLVEFVEAGDFIWQVSVFKWLDGEMINRTHKLWTAKTFENWGFQLGRMQRLSYECNFKGKRYERHHWDDPSESDFVAGFEKRFPDYSEPYQEMMNAVQGIEKTDESFGLSHMDLHNGNIICDADEIHCIDFDDMCYNYFVSDLMIPIYSALLVIEDNHEKEARDFALPLFRGFKMESPVTPDQMKNAGVFLKLRDFEMKFVMDLWGIPKDNLMYVIPSRNVDEGSPLYYLPWQEWFEEA